MLAWWLCACQVFKYLRLNQKISVLWSTIYFAFDQLLMFMVVFLIMLAGFGFAAIFVFGTKLGDFRDITNACSSLLRALLGEFDYTAMRWAAPSIAPIFFGLYIFIVVLVSLNLIIAIVVDGYEKARNNLSGEEDVTAWWREHATKGGHGALALDYAEEYRIVTKVKGWFIQIKQWRAAKRKARRRKKRRSHQKIHFTDDGDAMCDSSGDEKKKVFPGSLDSIAEGPTKDDVESGGGGGGDATPEQKKKKKKKKKAKQEDPKARKTPPPQQVLKDFGPHVSVRKTVLLHTMATSMHKEELDSDDDEVGSTMNKMMALHAHRTTRLKQGINRVTTSTLKIELDKEQERHKHMTRQKSFHTLAVWEKCHTGIENAQTRLSEKLEQAIHSGLDIAIRAMREKNKLTKADWYMKITQQQLAVVLQNMELSQDIIAQWDEIVKLEKKLVKLGLI